MSETGKTRQRHSKPTMREVAEHARVSPTTVSFVINNVENVTLSDETRARVWTAVQNLGYRPNPVAQSLRTRTSSFVGLVADAVATTPYAVDLIKGAQDCARARGKLLLVIDADGNAEQRERAFEVMLEQNVAGVLYAAMFHQEVELPEGSRALSTVLVDCTSADDAFPAVVPDEVQGGRLATEKLIEKGHRRVGMVTNEKLSTGYPAPAGRLEGYKQALYKANLPFDADLVIEGDGNALTGYTCTRQLMGLKKPAHRPLLRHRPHGDGRVRRP